MTITEAGAHIGERVMCALWDGTQTEGVLECVIGQEVFIRRPGLHGVLASPEKVMLATVVEDSGRLF